MQHSPNRSDVFWRSRAGMAFILFVAAAALLLAYQHRIHLLTGDGLLLLLLLACVAMHLFMHGGHKHGGGGQS